MPVMYQTNLFTSTFYIFITASVCWGIWPFTTKLQNISSWKTRFTTYNISLIQNAWQQDITSRNIKSAWRATELIPYNLSAVFDKISTRPYTDYCTLPSASTPI